MWVHDSEELYHHGVKGMRWGVRRTKAQLARSSGSSKRGLFKFSKKKKNIKDTTEKPAKKKSIKDMTDEELKAAIDRMEGRAALEKRYSELTTPAGQKKTFDGKKFVMNALEKSGENLATQVFNEIGAKAINKAFGYEAVYANNKKK